MVVAYDIDTFKHGFRPSQPAISSLFYSMFLHGGFGHLAGNMPFLWIYGDNVEHRLGHKRYLLTYLVWVVATLSYGLFTDNEPFSWSFGRNFWCTGILLSSFQSVKVFVFFFPLL